MTKRAIGQDRGMSTNPPTRSVKFSDDERGGWSSDRPRRDGAAQRPVDVSTRCRTLTPSDRLRYSPGSLLLIVAPSARERDRFAARVLEDRNAYLSLDKVRALLAGRVPADQVEARAVELLDTAVGRRIEAGESVVLGTDGLGPEERERYVRMAHAVRRPRRRRRGRPRRARRGAPRARRRRARQRGHPDRPAAQRRDRRRSQENRLP